MNHLFPDQTEEQRIEIHRRILVAAAAYAYEVEADPIIDDVIDHKTQGSGFAAHIPCCPTI